ncbi:MAG: hypothetical protein KIT17_12405 [Rubrivivax sp.]|nr:hypothetical protein [Rubrivivax sp.]
MSFVNTADSETLYACAIATMFASLLPWGLVGAIVGRVAASFEVGLGTAMVLFGVTGLLLGAGVGWIVLVLSDEVTGHAAGCTTLEPPGEATVLSHRQEFVARLPGGAERRLASPRAASATPRRWRCGAR